MELKASVAPKYAALASAAASGHRIVLQSSSLPVREVKEISTVHGDVLTASKPLATLVEPLAALTRSPTKQATMQLSVPGWLLRLNHLCMSGPKAARVCKRKVPPITQRFGGRPEACLYVNRYRETTLELSYKKNWIQARFHRARCFEPCIRGLRDLQDVADGRAYA